MYTVLKHLFSLYIYISDNTSVNSVTCNQNTVSIKKINNLLTVNKALCNLFFCLK